MALLLDNATVSTTRGSSTVLSAVRAMVCKARIEFTPDGAQRTQEVLIDSGQDVRGGDYLTVTYRDGTQLRGSATFWDPVRGHNSRPDYDKLTIVGGLLPVAQS